MPLTYITIYTEVMDVIDELDDDAAGRLIKALLHHAVGDDVYPVGEERLVYKMMAKSIDQHAQKYAEVCQRNRANINARWQQYHESKSHTTVQSGIRPNTTEYERIRPNDLELKDKDKDKDKDKIKVKVNVDSTSNRKRFSPPTVDEVSTYCKERGNNVDAQRFVDFYASKGWKVGSNAMKDWQAAVRTWEKRDNTPAPVAVKQPKVVREQMFEQREYQPTTGLPDWMREELAKMENE